MDVLQKPVPRPTASNGRNRAIKNRTELTAGDMVIYPCREATIGMNDYNIDYIQESTYLRHNAPIRSFSDPFMQGLIGSFRDVLSQRRAVQVVRIPNPEAEFSLG